MVYTLYSLFDHHMMIFFSVFMTYKIILKYFAYVHHSIYCLSDDVAARLDCPSEDCVSKKAKQISPPIILLSGAVCGLFKNDNK